MHWQVNKALVPMKAHYFLFNAGTGPIVPYLSLYARQLGFSSVIVGFIYAVLPVSGMLAKPLFGVIADRFQCQKKIFLISQLVVAITFLAIFYSPKLAQYAMTDILCGNDGVMFQKEIAVENEGTLVENLRNKNTISKCLFNCPVSQENLTVLCNDWNLERYCTNKNNNNSSDGLDIPENLSFLSLIPLGANMSFSGVTNNGFQIVTFKAITITVGNQLIHPVCLNNTNEIILSSCKFECDDNDLENLFIKDKISDSDVYGIYQFWVFLALMVLAWIGQAVTTSIGDAICFGLLGNKPNRYGYQRMYGALGWGILSLSSAVIVDRFSVGKIKTDYSLCFYIAALFLLLDFVVSLFLKYEQITISSSILKDIGKLLICFRIQVFLLWCICVGMCTGLMWQFLLWLVDDLGQANGQTNITTLQGIIMGVQCLGGELPFFFLSGIILKKIGHIKAMSLVLFTLGIRFVLYSVIKNPWYFIPIEFSNGLTFGLFYACMASYASIAAPPGTEATMQGLVGAVFEGIGVSCGSAVAGWLWKIYNGSITFRYFGIAVLLACAVHMIVQFLIHAKVKVPDSTDSRKHSFEKIGPVDRQELESIDPLLMR